MSVSDAFKNDLTKIEELVKKKYSNINTQRKHFTKARTEIKTKYGKDSPEYSYSVHNFGIGKKAANEFKLNERKRIEANNDNVSTVNIKKVATIVRRLAESNDKFNNMIAVGASTGVRLIELLNPAISTFTAQDNKIIQDGTAKMEESKQLIKDVLFLTPNKVLELIKFIRKSNGDISNLTNAQISSRYSKQIKKVMEKEFPETVEHHNKFHYLRRLYANIGYELLTPKTITKNAYLMTVLGHKDLQTSLSYNNIEPVKTGKTPVKMVEFKTNTNTIISLPKLEKKRGLTVEDKIERVRRARTILENNNINTSIRNIIKLGISQATIRDASENT